MIEYIKDLGITTFKNAVYKYKTKKIEILGDGTFYNTDVVITSYSIHYTKLYDLPRMYEWWGEDPRQEGCFPCT